jgi:acetate kinase
VPTAPKLILTVNAGSSSLKLRVLDEDGEIVCSSDADRIDDEADLQRELGAILEEAGTVAAAGHRVVHGGAEFDRATLVDPSVEQQLEALADLAPLHNPPAVAAMRALSELRPGLPTVACFDTAFHTTIPAPAAAYAIPAGWSQQQPVRRYGFHGLSHAYASRRAAELLGRPMDELRLVTAHLGAGASLAAVSGGRSVDTTMGFTPLEGLIMATRSGSVDPGALLWVQRHRGIGAEEMEIALERESGLLALSGRSGDMREVLAGAEDGDERCRLALDAYLHRLAGAIAAMSAAMGGLDGLVFTGGVGEGSAAVRAGAIERAGFLGLEQDRGAGDSGPDSVISPPGAAVAAIVVQAREDIEIADQVRKILAEQ